MTDTTTCDICRVASNEPVRLLAGTNAPHVIKDKVLVGISGGEFGVRGWIAAFDADPRQRGDVRAVGDVVGEPHVPGAVARDVRDLLDGKLKITGIEPRTGGSRSRRPRRPSADAAPGIRSTSQASPRRQRAS